MAIISLSRISFDTALDKILRVVAYALPVQKLIVVGEIQNTLHGSKLIFLLKGAKSEKHFEEHDAQTPNICEPLIPHTLFENFGSNPTGSPDHGIHLLSHPLGRAQIRYLHQVIFPQQNVAGLDISVNNIIYMQVV